MLAEAGVAPTAGLALVCDVRAEEDLAAAAAAVEERWGAASIVVPAAGVAVIAPLEEIAAASFRETIDTNLTGASLLIASLLGAMKRRGSGWIFPILSPAARRGFPGWSAYCASKWGLAGLVAALREELAGSGVRITAVFPGATATPLWDGLAGSWDRARMVPVAEVGRAVEAALDGDPVALVEEIHLGPAGGAL